MPLNNPHRLVLKIFLSKNNQLDYYLLLYKRHLLNSKSLFSTCITLYYSRYKEKKRQYVDVILLGTEHSRTLSLYK
jgi:hypothetical protein